MHVNIISIYRLFRLSEATYFLFFPAKRKVLARLGETNKINQKKKSYPACRI
jgi:hypothetical protein